MMAANVGRSSINYWVCTVSKEHVKNGVEWGIAQACHGKSGPLEKMKPGDGIVYYSPKRRFDGGTEKANRCQQFTAIGKIAEGEVYQVEMSPSFKPFRRKVTYYKSAQSVSIGQLLPELSFTKGRGNAWGMVFRNGIRKITESDYQIIAKAMQVDATVHGTHIS